MLRESGFASVRQSGTKRCYSMKDDAFKDINSWLDLMKTLWSQPFEALSTEIDRVNAVSTNDCCQLRETLRLLSSKLT